MCTSDIPYALSSKEDLVLRDYLAAQRTVLANERTLLAYLRTALGAFVAGVSLMQFFSTSVIHVLGWVLCVAAIVTVLIGTTRYRQVERSLRHLSVSKPWGPG